MKLGQLKKIVMWTALVAMTCMFLVNNAEATNCRLDWNGDFQVDESDYLVGDPMGGYYAEWYIFIYYPSYYPVLFPGADSSRLDYNEDGTIDQDDLMGALDAATDTEGYYVEWYIFMYYPSYYPIFMPEYDVCPPLPVSEGCAGFEIIDVGGPDSSSWPDYFTELDGKMYFSGTDPVVGQEILVYDPATEQVTVASDVNPGSTGSGARDLIAHDGKLYFKAIDYTAGWDAEPHVFDPATGITTKIDINPTGSAEPTSFFSASNGMLYFNARFGPDNDQELFEYNPNDGTHTIHELFPGTDPYGQPNRGGPEEIIEYNGKLYMQAGGPLGEELYSFDLTTNEYELLADIAPGDNGTGLQLSSRPKWLTIFNGELFFSADKNAGLEVELWIYNFSTGLAREIEIDTGQGIFGGGLTPAGGGPAYLTPYNGKLYMSAQQVPVGNELFVYDPATDDVTLAWDSALGQFEFCGGYMGSPPCLTTGYDGHTGHLTLYNGIFYFSAPFDNKELWYYDPATDEGGQLFELFPGNNQHGNPGHGSPKYITGFDDKLFMQGSTSDATSGELIIVSWAPENCP